MLSRCIEQAGHCSGWRCATVAEATGQLGGKKIVADILLLDVRLCRQTLVANIQSMLKHQSITILLCVPHGFRHNDEIFAALANGAMHVLDIDAQADVHIQRKAIRVLQDSGRWLPPQVRTSCFERRKLDRCGQKTSTLVVIGASTGGPATIVQVLQKLPCQPDIAVVLIQHLGTIFTQSMSEWMDKQTDWPVHLAEDGKEIVAGEAVLISGDQHWQLDAQLKLRISIEDFGVFMPSINAFMFSLSSHWHGSAIGVLLTGMGEDGAAGLAAMQKKAWPTFAQDNQSSAVSSMPRAAVKLGAADQVLSPGMIGVGVEILIKTASVRNPSGNNVMGKKDKTSE